MPPPNPSEASDSVADSAAENISPTPEPTPPSNNRRGNRRGRGKFRWFWFGIFTGTLLSAAGLGFAAWAWFFINEELSPLISRTLTESLGRPVELGEVEQVTFSSLRLGPSQVGVSDNDPTTLRADAVTVDFNLIETLLTRELGLGLTIEGAEGYLEQDEDRGWLNVTVPEQDEEEKDRRFDVRVEEIHVRDSQLTLVPIPPSDREPEPILINEVRAEAAFDRVTVAGEDTTRSRFEVTGDPAKGGEIALKGEVQPIEAVAAEAEEDAPQSDSLEDLETNLDDDPIKVQYATNLAIQADQAPVADVLSFYAL